MDSNFESLSPENADRNPSLRKSSSDKVNRKYRRHSSPSGSDSSSSDGPKHGRTHSPYFSRDEPAKISDVQLKKKNDEGEFAMESGRGRESHKHSDKRSYRSSHDYYRHDDYDRYRKRGDDGGRNHHRSSGYGREASSGIRSDYTRQKFDHDTSGDYRRNTDRYSREESDGEEHRSKDKDREHREKDSSRERSRSSRRHSNSYGDASKPGERHGHKKDGGRDNSENYFKSLDDDQNTHSIEEGTRRQSREGKEGNGDRVRETQTSNMKDLDRQKSDTTEKRKHHDRESDRHKGKFARETDGKDYTSSNNRGSYSRDGQFQDNRTRTSDDYKSSPKKSRLFTEGKDQNNGKEGQSFSESPAVADEKLPLRSKLPQETIDKVITKPAPSSNEAEASNDFSAAKVAAIKAAELVNRNLVGGGVMSTDQKKKLLWGSKKTTAAEETGHRWDVPLFSDRERQEKFNKLMSLRLPCCLWPIVGCEGRGETRAQTREQGHQWASPGREAGATTAGFREAIHCWTATKRWSYCRTRSVINLSSPNCTMTWVCDGIFFRCSFKNHDYVLTVCLEIFGKECLLPMLLILAIWNYDLFTMESCIALDSRSSVICVIL